MVEIIYRQSSTNDHNGAAPLRLEIVIGVKGYKVAIINDLSVITTESPSLFFLMQLLNKTRAASEAFPIP